MLLHSFFIALTAFRFDLEYPLECDDEYWDHPDPSLNFKQPPDKPSALSCFVQYLVGASLLTQRVIDFLTEINGYSGIYYANDCEYLVWRVAAC